MTDQKAGYGSLFFRLTSRKNQPWNGEFETIWRR